VQSQKNQVFETIKEAGFSPDLFELEDPSSSGNPTWLFVKNTKFYYSFSDSPGSRHFAKYSPGDDVWVETQNPGSWEGQIQYVRQWLEYLRRELDAADKWKVIEEEIRNVDFEDINFDEEKFTSEEYKLLETKINELKEKIAKLDIVEEQIEKINDKLDHLLELAKKMNKTDWKELFIGSLLSLFLQLSIDTGTGRTIFEFTKNLFQKLLPSG
jgi:hypothetical protein